MKYLWIIIVRFVVIINDIDVAYARGHNVLRFRVGCGAAVVVVVSLVIFFARSGFTSPLEIGEHLQIKSVHRPS